jgi:hypothetical protein
MLAMTLSRPPQRTHCSISIPNTLLWLAPALIHDFVRRGAVHRAYVIELALLLPREHR